MNGFLFRDLVRDRHNGIKEWQERFTLGNPGDGSPFSFHDLEGAVGARRGWGYLAESVGDGDWSRGFRGRKRRKSRSPLLGIARLNIRMDLNQFRFHLGVGNFVYVRSSGSRGRHDFDLRVVILERRGRRTKGKAAGSGWKDLDHYGRGCCWVGVVFFFFQNYLEVNGPPFKERVGTFR